MCVSYSGRCLLSNHFTGRDANRGQCAQPCRWNYGIYEIAEEKRLNEPLPIEQTERGTFIMSSRDTCMIEHIPEIVESGITSLKLEGRVKTAYYVATIVKAYREEIDRYLADPENYVFDENLTVKQNREMVIKHNDEVEHLKRVKQSRQADLDRQLTEDVVAYIKENYDLTEAQARIVEMFVYREKHSFMCDYFSYIDTFAEFADDIANIKE
jgi:collagenase-like PrtC family protease